MNRATSLKVDQCARNALNGILAQSIEERKEYGGMLYLQNHLCLAMPPRTQGDPTTVNVGQDEPNCSCPQGTTPIAYYHTHPTYSVGGLKAGYGEFSPEDMAVVEDHNLEAAYIGTLDGTLLKYDLSLKKAFPVPGPRLRNTKP